jgi:thioredoxin reductase (NADPH)
MHTHATHNHMHAPATVPHAVSPLIMIVDASPEGGELVRDALNRRFGADYRVEATTSCEGALDRLARMAEANEPVALVIADLWLGGMDGVAFLDRVHALHPDAVRALHMEMGNAPGMGDPEARDLLLRATALGQIDTTILKGWVSPEEWLYPQVQQALSRWAVAHQPRHEHIQIVGQQWSPRCHDLRARFTRSSLPFGFYDVASDEGKRLMAQHGLSEEHCPAIILFDGRVYANPSNLEIFEALGLQIRPEQEEYDLAIVGAGPAGLAAAVYGASEGLRTVVIESEAIGGQAGTSSRIRNYLGFPRGLGGGELTGQAYEQAFLFGAEFVFGQRVTALRSDGNRRVLVLGDGTEVTSRAVVIAAGVEYRRLGIPALDALIGAGVFYGAASAEAQAMRGQPVYVVGAGNSAGQAAVHLAKYAAQVTLLVRGDSLTATMSDYLIRELDAIPNVAVRLRTRIVDGAGVSRLETLELEDATGGRERVAAAGLFVMIGAEPHTAWLRDAVQLDPGGYILTGGEVSGRPALPLETSMPGVFAVGDVRHGPIKRVAAAVGDGSVAIGYVHQYLAEVART